MSRVESANRKLRELDTALVEHRIDHERYRFLRRTLLLEFHELAGQPSDNTRPEPTSSHTASSSTDNRHPDTAAASSKGLKVSPGKLVGVAAGGVLVIGAVSAAWWALKPKSEITPPDSPAPRSNHVMPQDLARKLMDSQWNRTDLTAFRDDWKRLPEASVRAAGEDPRLWLLRREIDERLRDTREAVALQADQQNLERERLLEEIQTLIRYDTDA